MKPSRGFSRPQVSTYTYVWESVSVITSRPWNFPSASVREVCPPVKWLARAWYRRARAAWQCGAGGQTRLPEPATAEFELASMAVGVHCRLYAGRGMWEWIGFSLHFKKMTLGLMGRRNWNGAGGLEVKQPVRGRFW